MVVENVKKSLSAMNLKNLITELTINYLNTYAVKFILTFRVMLTHSYIRQYWIRAGKV